MRRWDDAVSGVGECVKALKATEKVGKVSLVGPKTSKATLIAAHVAGEKPSSVVLSALTALTPAGTATHPSTIVYRVLYEHKQSRINERRRALVCCCVPPQTRSTSGWINPHTYVYLSLILLNSCE